VRASLLSGPSTWHTARRSQDRVTGAWSCRLLSLPNDRMLAPMFQGSVEAEGLKGSCVGLVAVSVNHSPSSPDRGSVCGAVGARRPRRARTWARAADRVEEDG
jgi:hypothetical protein